MSSRKPPGPRGTEVGVGFEIEGYDRPSDYYTPRPMPAHRFAHTQWYQRQFTGQPPPRHVSPYEPRAHYPSDRRAQTLHDKPAVYSGERLRMETWRSTVVMSWLDDRRDRAFAWHTAIGPGGRGSRKDR